jgi:hypothetical protein
MKVLILATDIFTRGGIARYTSALASSLGGMLGPENVDVLSFFDWGHADWGHTGDLPSEFRLLGTVCGRAPGRECVSCPRLRWRGSGDMTW